MKTRHVLLACAAIAATASADPVDGLPSVGMPKNYRMPTPKDRCETTYGDPVAMASAAPFSARWDDDVTLATPRGPFVFRRAFAGERRALGQTEVDAAGDACRTPLVGARRPWLTKSGFGGNQVSDAFEGTQPGIVPHLTIHSLTSLVDTRCGEVTRVLTPDGDVRFFAPVDRARVGQFVARTSRALSEPSRLRYLGGSPERFEWLAEDGRRMVFADVNAAPVSIGQYRLVAEYDEEGLLRYEVDYAFPVVSSVPGSNGMTAQGVPELTASGAFKPYTWAGSAIVRRGKSATSTAPANVSAATRRRWCVETALGARARSSTLTPRIAAPVE